MGGIRAVYEYSNNLARRGHDVVVLHARKMPQWALPPAGLEMRLRRIADRARNRLLKPPVQWQFIEPGVSLRFVEDLSAANIPDGDVVVATWWATALIQQEYPASKGMRAHLIQHYEDWTRNDKLLIQAWRSPSLKIVIAQWLMEKGLELGVPRSDLAYIRYGMNHNLFRLISPIEGRPQRVAMFYSAQAWKGGEDGVRALEETKARNPKLEAVLFGVDRRPRSLPRWIEYIRNPPQQALVRDIYNGSSIYLCPSWSEGWGLPAGEAMACGCALVSAETGGVREFAEHGVTALLSRARMPGGLADNLSTALTRPDVQQRIASAGHQRIQEFTWERSTDSLISALTTYHKGVSCPGMPHVAELS